MPLAQPGTVRQLGTVLDKQETGWATISLSWDMPAPELNTPFLEQYFHYLLCAQTQVQARGGIRRYWIGLQGGTMEWGLQIT